MQKLRFTKLQGLGNDFLIIPVENVRHLDAPDVLAQQMCERNYGAGADGIIFVAPSQEDGADVDSRIFNLDGSEAEVSGNGTRCVAAYFYFTGQYDKPAIRINTTAGVKTGKLVNRDGLNFEFEFDMGEPCLTSAEIPILLPERLDRVIRYPLKMGGELQTITCVSMGNPHCSLFLTQLDDATINELGPLLEDHPAFPTRTNVEFIRVISRQEIEVRYWERGVGRTLSSGTGSCAAAVASMLNDYTERRLRVQTLGGELQVNWDDNNRVQLTGSASVIYEGSWLQNF